LVLQDRMVDQVLLVSLVLLEDQVKQVPRDHKDSQDPQVLQAR